MARRNTVKQGDGHALPPYRWWQMLSRSLFHLYLTGASGERETWSVDVRRGGDSEGIEWALLYRDSVNQARSELPAAFTVTGGTIEVATSAFGLKRCHYVTRDGRERQLAPDPASAEGRRARLGKTHPTLSGAAGVAAVAVLAVALVLGVPQIIEEITRFPPIAERVGTFDSPIHLPAWANISLIVASVVASTERALRLRYNWLLDGGMFDGDE